MDRTNAERHRRYIRRLKARAAGAPDMGEVAALRQELAAAKKRIKDMALLVARALAFRDEFGRRTAKPRG